MKSSLRTKPQNDYKQGIERSDVLEIFPGWAVEGVEVEQGWRQEVSEEVDAVPGEREQQVEW